jgi:hypothetical protein
MRQQVDTVGLLNMNIGAQTVICFVTMVGNCTVRQVTCLCIYMLPAKNNVLTFISTTLTLN